VAGRFRIEVRPAARRDLAALPPEVRPRVDAKILELGDDPYPPSVKRLTGSSGTILRVRAGDYRILYKVDALAETVLVLAVGHRRDVYR
jgi:mRNA interferase RelE/StbE